jgi:hypothetical protein
VFNRVLRRIFGPKRDEVIGGWRKLHNDELHNLYFSADVIRVIKCWRMRWAGTVACTREKVNSCFSWSCWILYCQCDCISAYGYYLDPKYCVYNVTVFTYVVYNTLIFDIGSWLAIFCSLSSFNVSFKGSYRA